MRRYTWRVLVAAALVGLIAWQQASIARMDEQYRVLRDRQDKGEAIAEKWPDMMRFALERHHNRLVAYWEAKDGGTKD